MDLGIDLVGRAIRIRGRSLLDANTRYELHLASTIRALSGRHVSDGVVFAVDVGDVIEPTPAPQPVTWTEVQPLLSGCAPFCHSPVGRSGRMRTATRLLDLTGDPRDATFGMIDVVSVGLNETASPLLRVAPGDAARSVLLRKLLGGVPASNDPPYPAMRVDGRRMPINIEPGAPPPAPFDEPSLRLVEQWISDGARVE